MTPQELASFLTQEVQMPAWRLFAILALGFWFMGWTWIEMLKNQRLIKQVSELKAIAAFSEPRRQKGGGRLAPAYGAWGEKL